MTSEDRTMSPAERERLKQNSAGTVRAVLHIGGNVPHELTRRVVIGREPVGGDGIDIITLTDDPIVSRSHLAFDVAPDGVVVTDLGSTNGTKIEVGGVVRNVPTDEWVLVTASAVVNVGNTPIRVEYRASAHAAETAPAVVAPEPAVCFSCGQKLLAGSRFCDGCGTLIAAASTPPPSTLAVEALPMGMVITAPPTPPTRHGADRASGRKLRKDLAGRASGATLLLKKVPIGVAATVVMAVVIGWVLFARGDNGGDLSASRPRVPFGIDEQWSVDIDGAISALGSGSDVFVLANEDGDATVISLDGKSGEERWSSDVGRNISYGYLTGVLDGVLLTKTCDFDDACELFAMDASTGDELWSDSSVEGVVDISSRGTLVVWESTSLAVLNPRDGKRIERVRGDSITMYGDHGFVRDKDEIEVFDLRNLSSVFGPVTVDEDIIGYIYQNGKLITAVDDELVVINADGKLDRESRVSADQIVRIIPGPGGMVIVGTDEGVLGLDPIDGRAEEIWSVNGSISFGFSSDNGPLVLVYDGDKAEVLDARTGDTRIKLREYFDSNLLIGSNGLVSASVYEPYEASAFRYSDGEELWEDDFDGLILLVDNGVVEIDDGEVRLFR